MTSHSSDFSYRKYSLEQLDNWVHDALNCDDLTPEDIYDTIVKCVDDSVEYHKTQLTKGIELLSLLKGHRPVDFDYTATGEKFPSVSDHDWENFWESPVKEKPWAHPESGIYKHYSEEELNAMCDAAEDKEKCREYNLREAEYYNKRAELDALTEQVKAEGGYEWTGSEQNDIFNNVYNSRREDKVVYVMPDSVDYTEL